MIKRRQAQKPGIRMIKIGWELEWFKTDSVDGNGAWSLFLQGAENVIGAEKGLIALTSLWWPPLFT